jgi:WD40 repeat protein/serine/threonine protein kinase
MTEQRLLQIRGLFEAALERAPKTRLEFLQQACPGDDALLREVQILINAHERTGGLLDQFLLGTTDVSLTFPSIPRLEGRRVGHYLIAREIGRGGMGIVYLALRADGAFQKQFAFKVVQSSLGSEELVVRFQREREILGSLDHPNIARLIDAGATEDGLPYYVMEYIEGQPIDAYCDEHRLNVTQRIALFRKICEAVQYAHQNLVVHRDLKPSNILVAVDGTVKLLDFGIAKLLDQKWEEGALSATATGMRVMTPEYASPEQIKGQPITTATDVYTLGVILYELLTGHRPYRLKSRLLHEVERAICEEEPTRPSTAVSEEDRTDSNFSTADEVSAVREGTVARLKRRLAGDIDNILLMALRKEPARRYPSAEQFDADLHRHLEGLPVIARTDTLAYRTQKFLLRHKLPVFAASAFLLFLLLALVTTARLYRNAKSAQASAEAGEVFAWAAKSLDDDPERSVILSLYAWGKQRSMIPGLEQFQHDALQQAFERQTFQGERVAWSPDGTKLATKTAVGTVRVWETSTGRELLAIDCFQSGITSVSWSPNGSKLATSSFDTSVKVWEIGTGRALLTLTHNSLVLSMAWSPTGDKLATAGGDGTAQVWDGNTGRKLLSMQGHRGSVSSVAWSPDGSSIATGSLDGTVKIWSTNTGRESRTLRANQFGNVNAVAWSPNGGMLAVAKSPFSPTGYGSVIVFDTHTGVETRNRLSRHEGDVFSVAWSPDGSRLATGGQDTTVRVWDVSSPWGSELLILRGHQGSVMNVVWSPNGNSLASASQDNTVKIWDLRRGETTLPVSVTSRRTLAWATGSDRLASVRYGNSTPIVWDAATGRELLKLRGHTGPISALKWSPDGNRLATASEDKTARVWDAQSGGELLTLRGHQGPVWDIAWSPTGDRLATASDDRTAKVWDIVTGSELLSLRGHQESVETVAWSPKGNELATASWDLSTKGWDTRTGLELFTLFGNRRVPLPIPFRSFAAGQISLQIPIAAWSPDGSKLVTVNWQDNTAKLWEAGKLQRLLPGLPNYDYPVTGIAWSSDGLQVATVQHGTVIVWEAGTGRKLLVLPDNRSSSVAWSPDGRRLATTGSDTTKVWDAQTGTEMLRLGGFVRGAMWSPDSKRLATMGDLVHVYAIKDTELLQQVRSRVTRNLTSDECRRFLNADPCPELPRIP